MKKKWIRHVGTSLLAAVWLGFALWAWLHPPAEESHTERRKLAQFPAFSEKKALDGSFMSDFESYTLDQFPARDAFRQYKSLFHYKVLNQSDNNGIYLVDGYASKLDYPLNTVSVDRAVEKFNDLYETYLEGTGSKIYLAVVPDKNYYLAGANGYPAMDYEALFSQMEAGMPWAKNVPLTDCLDLDAYYRTDTHWRQEKLLIVAEKLCEAMEVAAPAEADFTGIRLTDAFYGVYYGQAALPMAGENLTILENALLENCTVDNYETGQSGPVYDRDKLTARDPYDVYLSGATPLLTIHNPAGLPGRELIIFRDSFGSSLAPLLVSDYETVTLVDTRYVYPAALAQLLDFHGQDVLFLYSTLLLNSSASLR